MAETVAVSAVLLQFIDDVVAPLLHDRMTQCLYEHPPETFSSGSISHPVHYIDVIGKGRDALVCANTELGLLMYFVCVFSLCSQ